MPIKTSVEVPAPSKRMDDYQNRLESFANWEGNVSKVELAEACFFYSGIEDIVICYGCELQLKSWESSDVPWIDHEKFGPECLVSPQTAVGVTRIHCEKIAYPKFKSTRARKDSFSKHPTFSSTRRKEFVKNGFFYSRIHNCTICYYCGLGLKNWSSEDPLEIHQSYFIYCPVCTKNSMGKPAISPSLNFRTPLKSITEEERADIEKKLRLKRD